MRRGVAVFLTCVLFSIVSTPSVAATVESLGDAMIAHTARFGSWTIAAGGASLSARIDPSQDYKVISIVGPCLRQLRRPQEHQRLSPGSAAGRGLPRDLGRPGHTR